MEEEAQFEINRARNAVMGTAIDVDPWEALLWCVRITAGEVAYATQKVRDLDPQDALARPETETEREIQSGPGASYEKQIGPWELNIWIKVRQQATERLAKFSKMALDAGVAERQVQLAEGTGEHLATAIQAILTGLQLTAEQETRAPELVREALVVLEGGGTRPAQDLLNQAT